MWDITSAFECLIPAFLKKHTQVHTVFTVASERIKVKIEIDKTEKIVFNWKCIPFSSKYSFVSCLLKSLQPLSTWKWAVYPILMLPLPGMVQISSHRAREYFFWMLSKSLPIYNTMEWVKYQLGVVSETTELVYSHIIFMTSAVMQCYCIRRKRKIIMHDAGTISSITIQVHDTLILTRRHYGSLILKVLIKQVNIEYFYILYTAPM